MADIVLKIRDKVFNVKKEILCEHSDYFQAMFSGKYVEEQQKEIIIDMLDPDTMTIVLQYMNIGLIDLSEYPSSVIGDIAVTANFLQITELIKQIEYTLDIQLCESNWMETMAIAENSSYLKLQQFSAAFGLYSFQSMKPEYVPTLSRLAWYLSHPYLDAPQELDVYNFGYQWILNNETGADALLIILACIDFKRLTYDDICEIKKSLREFENSLARKVVNCLLDLFIRSEISEAVLIKNKIVLCQTFTERVWTETLNIVRESKTRFLKNTPIVPMWVIRNWKPELLPHFMYTFSNENGFKQWLEVSEKNLWGWSAISWGLTKLVIVCGEHGRGTGIFMNDVKVYDTLRKEWTRHGVELPRRRHAGLAVVGDSLYLVGGVGGYRVVLETVIIYDLRQRTFRNIAKLPDAIQNPAVCSHNAMVYVAGEKNIFCYDDLGSTDCWTRTVGTDIRMSCIRSFKGYIYCIQNYFSHLYRFRPGIDEKLELITNFSSVPATLCDVGDHLKVFTRTVCGQSDTLVVEEFDPDIKELKPKVVFKETETALRVNDVAGSCVLALTLPPLCSELSAYKNKYLMSYTY